MTRFSRTILVLVALFMVSGAQATAVLYGVTGDGASVPETLYTLNTGHASAPFVTMLGNGDDGELAAVNPTVDVRYARAERG